MRSMTPIGIAAGLMLGAFLCGRATAPVVNMVRPVIVQPGVPCDKVADEVGEFLAAQLRYRDALTLLAELNFHRSGDWLYADSSGKTFSFSPEVSNPKRSE